MPAVAGFIATWSLAHVVEAAIVRTILVNVVLGALSFEEDGVVYVAVE